MRWALVMLGERAPLRRARLMVWTARCAYPFIWSIVQLFPDLTIPHISGGGGALVSAVERGVAPRSCVEPRTNAGLLDADVLRDGSGAPGQSGWMVST